MSSEFDYQPVESKELKAIAFSAGTLSQEGEEGLNQLLRVCELIETYSMEDQPNA